MKNRGGFTIVETLITLAVSSIIFVTIMAVFSGRQGRVEFSQGIRDIEAYIQDIGNDVRNGYYPTINQKCGIESGSLKFYEVTNPADYKQGTSGSCVFAGKVMFFNGADGKITAYSIAGDKSATSLSSLKQTVMGVNATETAEDYQIPASIKLIKSNEYNINLMMGLFFDVSSSSSSSSTSIKPYIIKVGGSDIAAVNSGVKNAFISGNSTEISPDGIKLCFKSGSSNQYATITVSKSINGLSTTVLIGNNVATGCAG